MPHDLDAGRCLSNHSIDELARELNPGQAVEGIRRGLASLKQGKGRPAKEFFAEMRKMLRIPRSQQK